MFKLYLLLVLVAALFLSCVAIGFGEEDDVFKTPCGNGYYNPEVQICSEQNVIYGKCGSSRYDELNQICEGNTVKTKCGNEFYNSYFEHCVDNVVKEKEKFIDSRDGKIYYYVTIGTQTWMAENLRYETPDAKCYDCEIFGMLYAWKTAINICPDGWHLPSDNEWDTLRDFVENISGCSNCAGILLKSTSYWYYYGNGTDDFGFSALPGGKPSSPDRVPSRRGIEASFWSLTSTSDNWWGHFRYLSYLYINLLSETFSQGDWTSVRCLKD
jgi:uncharacterized protein (TIGR02145 family)